MKFVRNFFAAILFSIRTLASVSAYENENIMSINMGQASREEFVSSMEELGNDSIASMFSLGLSSSNLTMTAFDRIYDEVMDAEDKEMYDVVKGRILGNLLENSMYISSVIRKNDQVNRVIDGWVVFSHAVDESDIESYVFYFKATF